MAGEHPPNTRRLPQQERSVQRVETILATAAELITVHGVAKLKITDVAKKAGLPIGSIYQYFPDKTAIVKALFERFIHNARARVIERYAEIQSLDHAIEVTFEILHWYQGEMTSNPARIAVWLGTETDLDLMKFHLAEIELLADLFLKSIQKYLPPDLQADMEARTFLLSYLTGSVMKMALLTDQDMSQRLLREWKAVLLMTLFNQGAPVTILEPDAPHANAGVSEKP
jgi:AcrR family transcriptional regulator